MTGRAVDLSPQQGGGTSLPGRHRRAMALLLFVLLLVGCDHGTKHLAARRLKHRPAVELVGGLLDLRYTENRDTAFGTLRLVPLAARRPLIIGLQAAISLLLLGLLWRRAVRLDGLGLALVLAGAIGNLTDRLLRGFVVDFIHLHHWPVFNVADVLVVSGVGLLVLAELRRRRSPCSP